MSDQNNTPPLPDVELKFQMHDMTKMIERMNLMMGNVCDRLEKVGKHGNVAGTCTQDVRKVGAQHKSNNGGGAKRPRWADYEDFMYEVLWKKKRRIQKERWYQMERNKEISVLKKRIQESIPYSRGDEART